MGGGDCMNLSDEMDKKEECMYSSDETDKKEESMFLSDKIDEEYKGWEGGKIYFLESPTGTGKTTFILDKLLPFARANNKRILYLVNRKILKEQLEAKFNVSPIWETMPICIETYQTLERKLTQIQRGGKRYYMASGDVALAKYAMFDYVVCDECHYFLADSTFNTYTEKSFQWIQNTFRNKIRVFISATIDEIMPVIKEETQRVIQEANPQMTHAKVKTVTSIIARNRYTMKEDYSNLNVDIISDYEEIAKMIERDTKSKWLIFVDSIDLGRSLEKEIQEKYENLEVVMLSARYRYDETGFNEVKEITEKRKQQAQILIATSVMDNGISLEDGELRNIVIMADTKVEFIQMLGRKRRSLETVNVYLFRYNQKHFIQRRDYYIRIKEIGDTYYRLYQETWQNQKNDDAIESDLHRWLLDSIFREFYDYNLAKKLFYADNGILKLNKLALVHVTNLVTYYHNIVEEFDKGDDYVFIREQLKWLGKNDESAKEIIEDYQLGEIGKSIQIISKAFEEMIDTQLTEEENLKLKAYVKESFEILIREVTEEKIKPFAEKEKSSCDKEKLLSWIGKSGSSHPITKTQMLFLRMCYEIPYEIKTISKSKTNETKRYQILKLDE